jgi:hypothetical protein
MDEIPKSWAGLVNAIYNSNGILVTFCICMVAVLYLDGRERDQRVEKLLSSNTAVLASNAILIEQMKSSIEAQQARTDASVTEMRSTITRIETGIDRLENKKQ